MGNANDFDWSGNTVDVLLRAMKQIDPDWQPDAALVEAARAYCDEPVALPYIVFKLKPPEGGR